MCVEGGDVPPLRRLVLELGRTEGAAVWSLFRVDPEMSGELRTCEKPDWANVATVASAT